MKNNDFSGRHIGRYNLARNILCKLLRAVQELAMTKAISVILGLLMVVQIIRPVGLPGLKRRVDAWKIAVLALALILAVATLRPPAAEAARTAGERVEPDQRKAGAYDACRANHKLCKR